MTDITKIESPTKPTAVISKINELVDTTNNKQDTLVSGTNIKTINGNSLLGSGNINIDVGSDVEAFTAAEVQTIWNGVS